MRLIQMVGLLGLVPRKKPFASAGWTLDGYELSRIPILGGLLHRASCWIGGRSPVRVFRAILHHSVDAEVFHAAYPAL